MFSEVSVCSQGVCLQRGSTYRGRVCLQRGVYRGGLHTGGSAYRGRVCLQRGFDYRGGSANRGGSAYRGVGPTSLRLTSSGCHCSGWYASYWNASLLTCVIVFTDKKEQLHKPRIRQPWSGSIIGSPRYSCEDR